MSQMIAVNVSYKGRLFSGDMTPDVRAALNNEVMVKARQRLMRYGARGSGGHGLGVQRNTITSTTENELQFTVHSTAIWPRTKGTTKVRKDTRIIMAAAPNWLNATARRIADAMSGESSGLQLTLI